MGKNRIEVSSVFMDIRKYTAYFHDGSVESINHQNNHIEILLESAEMDPDDVEDNTILSTENTIKIKVNIYDISEIKENDHLYANFYQYETSLGPEIILWLLNRPNTKEIKLIKFFIKTVILFASGLNSSVPTWNALSIVTTLTIRG